MRLRAFADCSPPSQDPIQSAATPLDSTQAGLPANYSTLTGMAPAEFLREPRLWGRHRSWGALAAANGVAAITFDHRSSEGRTQIEPVLQQIHLMLDNVKPGGRCARHRSQSRGGPVGLRGRPVRIHRGTGSSVGSLPGRLSWTDGPADRFIERQQTREEIIGADVGWPPVGDKDLPIEPIVRLRQPRRPRTRRAWRARSA